VEIAGYHVSSGNLARYGLEAWGVVSDCVMAVDALEGGEVG